MATSPPGWIEGIPSPTETAQMEAVLEWSYGWATKWESMSAGWTKVESPAADVALYEATGPEVEGGVFMRSEVVIPTSIDKVLEIADNVKDLEQAKKHHTELRSITVIKQLTEHTFIRSYVFDAPWPLSGREFVVLGQHRKEGDKVYSIGVSINTQLAPFDPKLVRGEMRYCAIAEPAPGSPGSTKYTRLNWVNIRGNVPLFLASMKKKDEALKMHRLSDLVRQVYKL